MCPFSLRDLSAWISNISNQHFLRITKVQSDIWDTPISLQHLQRLPWLSPCCGPVQKWAWADQRWWLRSGPQRCSVDRWRSCWGWRLGSSGSWRCQSSSSKELRRNWCDSWTRLHERWTRHLQSRPLSCCERGRSWRCCSDFPSWCWEDGRRV